MTPQRLNEHLQLLQEPVRLNEMARRAREQAMPDAARRVADVCIEMTGWKEAA